MTRSELRKHWEKIIIERYNNNDFDRVRIEKDVLEFLLFSKFDEIYDPETKECIKKPAKFITWYGGFLHFIDLSEISFDDVIWDDAIHRYVDERYAEFLPENPAIYMSNTNANIDFKKSYFAKYCNRISIRNIEFIGTDLSNNNLDGSVPVEIYNSNLSNTNIKINLNNNTSAKIDVAHFDNIDLSGSTVDRSFLEKMHESSFTNSKLNFKADNYNDIINIIATSSHKGIGIYGCTINGEVIHQSLKKALDETPNTEKNEKNVQLVKRYVEHLYYL